MLVAFSDVRFWGKADIGLTPHRAVSAFDPKRTRYESIHKAVQYQNSGAIQIGIMSGSDVITMDFKENLQCLKIAAPRTGTMRQT